MSEYLVSFDMNIFRLCLRNKVLHSPVHGIMNLIIYDVILRKAGSMMHSVEGNFLWNGDEYYFTLEFGLIAIRLGRQAHQEPWT